MNRSTFLVIPCFVIAGAAALASPPSAQPMGLSKLPPGEGRDTLIRVCAACHAVEVVANHGTDAAGWNTTVEKMAEHGAVATDAELAEITRYLVRSFPAEAAAKPIG